jgi:hypothetical protein
MARACIPAKPAAPPPRLAALQERAWHRVPLDWAMTQTIADS